jgi:D-amino-acid dehydrogenase
MSGHAVIVGGGVIGLSTALALALGGWRVTVVERGGERRDGCSFQNAGIIVPSHFVPLAAPGMVALGLKWMWNPRSPFRVKPRASWALVDWAVKFWKAANPGHVRRAAPLLRDLALASRGAYETLAAPGDDFGFVKSGTLMLCRTRHALDEEACTAEHARELGIPAEVLDAPQTAALDPGISMDVAGSVHYPGDCRVTPDRLMASLQRRAGEAGARFIWNADVSGWRTDGGRTVRALKTRDGTEIEADAFVLCAGAWSSGLARALGLALPLEAGAGYSLTLSQPRQLPRLCAILTEARLAVTPMGGALRFAGTMELAGLNGAINPARAQAIAEAAPRYYPALKTADFDGVAPWRGLRPCSPDGLPYLGRTRRYSNLVVATGHAMMGITLGPITGKLVAGILSDEKPEIDIAMLSPDRYQTR